MLVRPWTGWRRMDSTYYSPTFSYPIKAGRTSRARGQLPPRVVSMSTRHVDEVREPSKAADCYAHLVMPFKITELDATLLWE